MRCLKIKAVFGSGTKPDAGRLKNIVGPRLRQARRKNKPITTQADLSALMQAYGVTISRSAISKIETQERIVLDYELKAFGEALNIRVGWLIDEDIEEL